MPTNDEERLENAIADGLHSVYLAHDDAGNVIGHIGKLHSELVKALSPLVGELRAERTRTETLRDALDTYVIGCFMCGGTGVVIRPPKYDEVTCRECEDARAVLAASVEEPA